MAFADTLEFMVLTAFWAFTIWRFVTPQPPRGRAIRLVALFVALSFTINRREIAFAADSLLHVPDIAVPGKTLTTAAASAAMVHLTSLMPGPVAERPNLRRWAYGLLGAAAVAMVVIFLLVPRSPEHGDFVAEQAGTPLVTAYGVLTQFGLFVGLACCVALFHPAAQRAAPGLMRVGLRLLTVAPFVGLLFILNRVAFQVTNAVGSDLMNGPVWESTSRALLAAMLLAFAAGALLPALGGIGRWVAHYSALQRLRPLWLRSVSATPHVVLGDPPSRLADLLTLRGVDLRLYRRIIEIRDAQWEQGLAEGPSELDPAEGVSGRDPAEGVGLLGRRMAATVDRQPPADAQTSLTEQARELLRAGNVVATPELAPIRRPGHNDPPDAPSAVNVS
ncbi:MAB_1171c family putative transporter [Dactylosporangium sp. NPDC051541]|uniref:MAB_1171c family putative transporter n=1 Tax=Dactylosporangium sp. NPDC051541 TaxID=3363977 RepID=UPI0037A42549